MKTARSCPKCEGRKAYSIRPVQQTYCDAQGSLKTFDITGAHVATGEKSFLGGEKTKLELAGPMNAVVCATCGYTEWYATPAALAKLARMVGRSSGVVSLLEAKETSAEAPLNRGSGAGCPVGSNVVMVTPTVDIPGFEIVAAPRRRRARIARR